MSPSPSQTIATFAILVLSGLVLAYAGGTAAGWVGGSALLALFWQQSGWLAHDFLHHQVCV